MTVETAATRQDERLEALIARINRLFGALPGEPAAAEASARPDLFAFRDAMTAVEEEVYGTR